jgi:YtkA-like protein
MNRREPGTAVLLVLVMLGGAGCSKEPADTVATGGSTTGAGMEIGVAIDPNPPTAGDNTIAVTVKKDGAPVTDATVTTVFSMPAMPAMNMPEMRSSATLQPAGEGRYRGVGRLSMAGTWNVRVSVTRNGQELGTKTVSIVAR